MTAVTYYGPSSSTSVTGVPATTATSSTTATSTVSDKSSLTATQADLEILGYCAFLDFVYTSNSNSLTTSNSPNYTSTQLQEETSFILAELTALTATDSPADSQFKTMATDATQAINNAVYGKNYGDGMTMATWEMDWKSPTDIDGNPQTSWLVEGLNFLATSTADGTSSAGYIDPSTVSTQDQEDLMFCICMLMIDSGQDNVSAEGSDNLLNNFMSYSPTSGAASEEFADFLAEFMVTYVYNNIDPDLVDTFAVELNSFANDVPDSSADTGFYNFRYEVDQIDDNGAANGYGPADLNETWALAQCITYWNDYVAGINTTT